MKLNNLDLNLLVVFNAIYTEGSLTKAGEIVGITQPAVSSALAKLRDYFDDQLFIRVGQGVKPTAKTEYHYPRSRCSFDTPKKFRKTRIF